MSRVTLYARYSSDQQSTSSSVILRPGIQSLLRDAQAGRFEMVLAGSAGSRLA